MKMQKVSLVIPVYNEEESLPVLANHISQAINGAPYEFEVIFVNDGSADASLKMLLKLQADDARFKIIDFGRNFGHQPAFTAGLDHATGDAVILLNADLQDPPEMIPEFLEKWKEGYDVVYAVREKRSENLLKSLAHSLFYRVLNRVSSTPMPLDAGCFGLMDRGVVDVIRRMPERNRYLPGMRSYVGFRQIDVGFIRPPRYAGQSSGFRSLLRFALDGIFSFSTFPLTLISYLGFLMSLLSFIAIMYHLYTRLVLNAGPPGLATLTIALLFLGSMMLLSLGIIGQYIARIYDEVKARPLYTVRTTYGWEVRERRSSPSSEDARPEVALAEKRLPSP